MQFPILIFVARNGDQVAECALTVLREAGYRTRLIDSSASGRIEDVALVGWSQEQRHGLKHGFPGGYVRIAGTKRVDRSNVPPEFKTCRQVVYVRQRTGANTKHSDEAFRVAVLNMALALRRR